MSFAAQKWVMDDADIPSSQVFATMIVFASFANEHGRSYPSTATVAAKSRQNVKTVRKSIDAAELAGLLVDTGRRVGDSGHVKVYALGMEGLPKVGALRGEELPDACERGQDAAERPLEQAHPKTGALANTGRAPVFTGKPTQKREGEPVREPVPLEDANASSAPKGRKTRCDPASDWQVPPIADLPAAARRVAEQWPGGAYETHGEGHRAFCGGSQRRRDPGASWSARIIQLGAGPIRDGKAGLSLVRETGSERMPIDKAAQHDRTAALMTRMGRHDEADEQRRYAEAARAQA